MKKVIRIAAVIAGLTFLQYQQIASIKWGKVEVSIIALASTIASTLNENSTTLAISNFGIPLAGLMASGFTAGFLKG